MKQLVIYLQDASALAYVSLGVMTAVVWLRRRESSLGFLALAIILLALTSGIGRIGAIAPGMAQLLGQLGLLAFIGSGYALFLYRNALIPLPRRWHAVALTSLASTTGLFLLAELFSASRSVLIGMALVVILMWCACVGEPIVRFWLIARGLPAVQAWRLRSLSLGFGGLVLVLLFAITAGLMTSEPVIQIGIAIAGIAIVPFLYASFSPPAWLRRQWRAAEEDGLRIFMQDLLLARDHEALLDRMMEWAMRLAGGDAAVVFDSGGAPVAVRGINAGQVRELGTHLFELTRGVNLLTLEDARRSALMLPIAREVGPSTLIVLAGPFTPQFGDDEITRIEQLMTAFVSALDRYRLIDELAKSNAALKEANQHKSVFLANMSHELRTPLNAIIGFSELLADAGDSQYDPATRKRFLAQIVSSGKHLLGLINDILDLSKVEAGQMELRLQPVSVAETVDQVAKTIEPLLTRKNITFRTVVEGAGDVTADARKLKQMLLNLVSNAIKFTPEGGTVTVAAKRTAASMVITVADTGIGITEEDQKLIFQEFHQVDNGAARRYDGTGLGLALTRRFAMMHGGTVRVSSRAGEGSVFTLTLPLQREPAAAVEPSTVASNGRAHGPLVLVVEDDAAAAELLTRQLAAAGYRTAVATTGKDALVKARDLQPAAITLDVILPELDGWDVLTHLKSDETTSTIPVIVVSVVDNPDLGMALGAIDYFVKPIDGVELVNRLNRFELKPRDGGVSPRVMVVDDEPANRTWLIKSLEPAGFTVLPAIGGREAIELAKSQRPDLVLLDLMMPEVSGFDVVEALRADPDTRDTPIMVLTASSLTEADKRLLNGRVSQVLSRGTVGAADIVGLLRRLVVRTNGGP